MLINTNQYTPFRAICQGHNYLGLRSRSGEMFLNIPLLIAGVGHWPSQPYPEEKVGLRGYPSSSPGFAVHAPICARPSLPDSRDR